MFTVLIAEKEHIDAIQQENKLFFEPFLENKELAFCYWNPSGRNFFDSVPGLLDAVGRRKEWRAVIINNCAGESLKKQNPFDTADCSAVNAIPVPENQPGENESWDEWEEKWNSYYSNLMREKENLYRTALEVPLQKLATWLCFRPEDYILNDVCEKQDVNDWALEMLGRDDLKPGTKLELLERNQYKNEMRMKENIRREFVEDKYLNIAYPKEIHCISLRTARNAFFDPDTFWNIRSDSDYSAFADRNMFFDKMRFMVFDLLPKDHRNFRNDYIRFLATILIFMSNPLPGSAMKMRRLYKLEAENDDTPLCTLVTSYDKKLAATLEVIENEMEKIKSEIPGELSDKDVSQLFCTDRDVAMIIDEPDDYEKIYAKKDYGLFFDSPVNEDSKWEKDRRASEKEITEAIRRQERAVRKGVGQAHFAGEVSEMDISRLTPLQLEDVLDYANAAEDKMAETVPGDLANDEKFIARLHEESEKVKKVIRRRMKKKTVVLLSLLCVGLYLISLMPFIIANRASIESLLVAAGIGGVMTLILAAVMAVSLFFLQGDLNNAIRGYNNGVHEIMNDIRASMNMFPKYLTAMSNMRRGHAIRNFAAKNVDEYTKSLRIRKRHQEDIRRIRAFLEENYSDYLCDASYYDETMIRPYDYDFDHRTEYDYPAPFLAGDCRQIEFMSSGNFVTVPSSYITGITVRMEGIYDK